MRVIKSYGTVADHGSKKLKLETIQLSKDTGQTLALVSYKDGMNVGQKELTREEAKQLFTLLCEELNYKPTEKTDKEEVTEIKDETVTKTGKKSEDIIKILTTLPALDGNYTTILKIASADDIQKAITQMKESGGRHGTRIKACENQLKRLSKGKSEVKTDEPKTEEKSIATTKVEEKKPEPKIVQFPTEDKKPVIIPLKTEGERTYGECVAKAAKEKEMFKDDDSQYVLDGLVELAKVDQDFRNNFMREDKSYGEFMEYMFKAAQNGYCVKYGNVGWLSRDLGLALAIDYYNNDGEKQKEIEEEKRKKEAEERKAKIEANKKGAKKNGSNNSKKKGRTTA